MMTMMWESWTGILGSLAATLMFCWPILLQHFSPDFRNIIEGWVSQWMRILFPKMEICFNEYSRGNFCYNDAYDAIEGYLSELTSSRGRFLRADLPSDSAKVELSLDDGDEIIDNTFEGVIFHWSFHVSVSRDSHMYCDEEQSEKRMFKLSFHEKHREIVLKRYLDHVIKEGDARIASNRQGSLYTNDNEGEWNNSVYFKHPATFDNLAMDPEKKEKIKKDLIKFTESKDYYAKMGKAWKRGYLLYGPPGTGKTTMIAAMANLLNFDVYDLELTTVMNNTALRKLLINTNPKSIIVIEDIDCSLNLTGQRKKKKNEKEKKKDKKESSKSLSQVTLSGLLNFIDGLWSACGEERIIVFTTNHIDDLDPALIRSGRMDFHIEMSYCCFEAFKVLAKNYLGVESHPLFDTIGRLLEQIDISPADVAENLIPKTFDFDATTSLENLIRALNNNVLQRQRGELVEINDEEEEEENENEEEDEDEDDHQIEKDNDSDEEE